MLQEQLIKFILDNFKCYKKDDFENKRNIDIWNMLSKKEKEYIKTYA